MDIIEKEDTVINEDLLNSIKPNQSWNDEDLKQVYKRIGSLCLLQGSYQLSCKSYTLAGDRLNAMGALLKSGEKDKIITFASKNIINYLFCRCIAEFRNIYYRSQLSSKFKLDQ